MGSVRRKIRDTNVERVYAAEDMLPDMGREFDSIVECQRFVSTVQSVDSIFAGMTWISVRKAHGNAKSSWADTESNCISLLEHHMNEQVILHELAHMVENNPEAAYHDKAFCWTYLDLTLRWRGADTYLTLRNGFRSTGIAL